MLHIYYIILTDKFFCNPFIQVLHFTFFAFLCILQFFLCLYMHIITFL